MRRREKRVDGSQPRVQRISQLAQLLLLEQRPSHFAPAPLDASTSTRRLPLFGEPALVPFRPFQKRSDGVHGRHDDEGRRIDRGLGQDARAARGVVRAHLADLDEGLLHGAQLGHGLLVLGAGAARVRHNAD